jgi:hypothetical protein
MIASFNCMSYWEVGRQLERARQSELGHKLT